MCYANVFHFTHCDTQRRAIINPANGATAFHPFELPQQCIHGIVKLPTPADPEAAAPCPSHGTCCQAGVVYVCDKKDDPETECHVWQFNHRTMEPKLLEIYRSQLLPMTADDWKKAPRMSDKFAYEEDIRIEFFDAGVEMIRLASMGRHIVENFSQNEVLVDGAELEERDFLLHGEKYWDWLVARKELIQLTEAWEKLASVGCMEVCPAKLHAVHPWMKYAFAGWDKRQPVDFPQFPGIPFAFLDNIDHQDDLLRWHPYYARRDMPSTPTVVDCFWTSPSIPLRHNPELALLLQMTDNDTDWPGEWCGIMRKAKNPTMAIRYFDEEGPCHTTHGDWGGDSPLSVPSSRPRTLSTHSSGPRTPPWAIPYGQEPPFDWKEIHWDRPATLVESPAVGPKTIPARAEQISSVPYDDRMEANMFLFEQFVGVEEPANREFLSVSVTDDEETLKRRRSGNDLDDEEAEMQTAKRPRTA
ncbi:hypothetical protein FSST1_009681 [Fusarium sambucinum]